ncbi:MAG: hypothetical protein KAX50_12065, partial [Saprospiraceae bacterium]|nr:hypothetical protein [Saprospiraceae bacterium]
MKTPFFWGWYCIFQARPLSLLPFNVFSNLGERSQAPAKATEEKKGGSDKADIYAIEPIGAIALMQELTPTKKINNSNMKKSIVVFLLFLSSPHWLAGQCPTDITFTSQ